MRRELGRESLMTPVLCPEIPCPWYRRVLKEIMRWVLTKDMFGHSNVEFSYLCFLVYILCSFLLIYILCPFLFAHTFLRSLRVRFSDCLYVYYHIYLQFVNPLLYLFEKTSEQLKTGVRWCSKCAEKESYFCSFLRYVLSKADKNLTHSLPILNNTLCPFSIVQTFSKIKTVLIECIIMTYTVWLVSTARFSVHILLLHHYKRNLAHISDRYSSVIELHLSEMRAKYLKK